MTKRLPILSVVQINNPPFQRYLIEDQNGRVWTGKRFSSVEGPAVYAEHCGAAVDVHQILKRHFTSVEPVSYVVPVIIEVFSHEPFGLENVADYLSRTATLQMNTPANGNGPGKSLVLPRIEWHRIEQLPE